MNGIKAVNSIKDIPKKYRGTPIETLIRYQNFGEPYREHKNAEILVGMCMDNRKVLKTPENFAYVIRTGGGNLRQNEFKISFAIAVGGVTALALVGHDNCGMVNIYSKREQFINGLVKRAGWNKKQATEHFMALAPLFEIDNEEDFVRSEAHRLQRKYPGIIVAPFIYKIEDNKLYFLK
jgi:carbonic anhydrase